MSYSRPHEFVPLTTVEKRVLDEIAPHFHVAGDEAWRAIHAAKVTQKNGYRALESLLAKGLVDVDKEPIGYRFAMAARTGKGDLNAGAFAKIVETADGFDLMMSPGYGDCCGEAGYSSRVADWESRALWTNKGSFPSIRAAVKEAHRQTFSGENVVLQRLDGTLTPLFYVRGYLDRSSAATKARRRLPLRKLWLCRQRKRRALARFRPK